MTFWGLRLVSGKLYKQIVLADFQITNVTLDPQSVTSKEIVSLQAEINEESFLLCNLSLDHNIGQVHLNYKFYRGNEVTFSIKSESEGASVSLTGFTLNKPTAMENLETESKDLDNFLNTIEEVKRSRITVSKKDSSIKNEKENEASSIKVKRIGPKSEDRTLPKRHENNNKNKSTNKISLVDLKNSFEEEDEDDDDDEYTPEDDKDDEMEDEEGEEEEEEEEEQDEEEDEEDGDDDEDINIEEEEMIESEEIEEDSKENQYNDEVSNFLSRKKRRLSGSSPGRTPMPKSSKKQKMQDLSGSPILPDSSSKKRKSKKKTDLESSFTNGNSFLSKTPKEEEKKKELNSPDDKSDSLQSSLSKSKKKTLMGGVVVEDLVIGTGAAASNGKKVSVYYEGKLKNGQIFDKKKSGSFFKFKVGKQDVLKAWDIGIVGMKVGGKRRIVAPPAMAYGKSGFPPDVPPQAVLTFDVELKGVN